MLKSTSEAAGSAVKQPEAASSHASGGSRFASCWALDERKIFLNHGSFGACPSVILELQAELRRQMEAEPVQFLWRRYEHRLEPSRRILAEFIGAAARDVVFVNNATSAVNAVARSIDLRRGDEILTLNHDYNACRNALQAVACSARAKLVVAESPFPVAGPDQVVEAVLAKISRRTRLVMLDHVTSPTALVLPIEKIVSQLEGRGVRTLVDGAHAPGMLKLNLRRLGASYYTGNLHKWACAPKGAGFLWVRRDLQASTLPPVISHGPNTPRPGYSSFQDCFDWTGTFDPTPWMCAGPAIEYLGKLMPGGWTAIREANHRLAIHARRLLCDALQVEPPCPEHMLGAMATIPLPQRFQGRPKRGKIDPEQMVLYDKWHIEVPLLRFGGKRYFRISAQLYNCLAHYQYLAEAIRKLS